MSLYAIKVRGAVVTFRTPGPVALDGDLSVGIEGVFAVEALTRRAAEEIALARASELLTINDSGEGVTFEVVEEKALKKRVRS